MFIVCVGAMITTLVLARDLWRQNPMDAFFTFQISVWLWFTVLFANFAEAVAEGRGKAQAKALRGNPQFKPMQKRCRAIRFKWLPPKNCAKGISFW